MFCPDCGAKIPDGAGFCTSCGHSRNGAAASVMKSLHLAEKPKRGFTVMAAFTIVLTLLMFLILKHNVLFEFKTDTKYYTGSSYPKYSMGVFESDLYSSSEYDNMVTKMERAAITFYGLILTTAVAVCIFSSMNKGLEATLFAGINFLLVLIFKSNITNTWKDYFTKGRCMATGSFSLCVFCSIMLIVMAIVVWVYNKGLDEISKN